MPLYDYECLGCGNVFDAVNTVEDCDKAHDCPECGHESKKVIVLGHGGIVRTGDSVPWVRDAAKFLTNTDRPNDKLHTVQDLRSYYEAHPNVRPKESHPALPSSYGDALYAKPDPTVLKEKRNRAGNEYLRKLRRIEVSSRAA